MTTVVLNGNQYNEADHGRFEASLILDGQEIARTDSDTVIFYGGAPMEDVVLWANSYDISEIIER